MTERWWWVLVKYQKSHRYLCFIYRHATFLSKHEAKTVEITPQSSEQKKTMVAEPTTRYNHQREQHQPTTRFVVSAAGINPGIGQTRSSGIKI